MIDFDRLIIQTILRYTAEGSDKRNDLQIEQIQLAGSSGGPPLFMLAPVLEYQFGRMVDLADGEDLYRAFSAKPDSARTLVMPVDWRAVCATHLPLRGLKKAQMIESVNFPDPSRGTTLADLEPAAMPQVQVPAITGGTAKM